MRIDQKELKVRLADAMRSDSATQRITHILAPIVRTALIDADVVVSVNARGGLELAIGGYADAIATIDLSRPLQRYINMIAYCEDAKSLRALASELRRLADLAEGSDGSLRSTSGCSTLAETR